MRRLISFFAADTSLQTAVVTDMEEEKRYDLSEGDIWTKYPLQVMTAQLISYTRLLRWDADLEGFEYVDEDLWRKLGDAAQAISDAYEYDINSPKNFWSVRHLHETAMWGELRKVCQACFDQIPGAEPLSTDDKAAYANLLCY